MMGWGLKEEKREEGKKGKWRVGEEREEGISFRAP